MIDASDLGYLPGAPFTDEEFDAAVATVQAAAGWHIAPLIESVFTVDVDYCRAFLRLPTRKLVTVEEITDTNLSTVFDESTYQVLTNSNRVYKRAGYWPSGLERVEVDFTHGYADWPKDLWAVLAEVAATNRRDQTVRAQSAGVFTVAYGESGIATSPLSTRSALDRYLLAQPGMA